ncbi:MAG: DUF3592 domain-containing protein [Elusimicrobia bacterium]|nr:DUF3592 domain-containing protein [Elusimicrobiota bacterium]
MSDPGSTPRGSFPVFPVLLLIIGLFVVLPAAKSVQESISFPNWPHVEGEVLSSAIELEDLVSPEPSSQRYRAKVWFGYEVNGNAHVSRTIRVGEGFVKDRAAVEKILARYPEGRKVQVHYLPNDPEAGALEQGEVPSGVFWRFGLGAMMAFFGLMGVIAALSKEKNDASV